MRINQRNGPPLKNVHRRKKAGLKETKSLGSKYLTSLRRHPN